MTLEGGVVVVEAACLSYPPVAFGLSVGTWPLLPVVLPLLQIMRPLNFVYGAVTLPVLLSWT